MSLDPVQILSERFTSAIRRAFPQLAAGRPAADGASAARSPVIDPMITASKNPKFGDFQSNAAMSLARMLGVPPPSPREVAKQIVATLDLGDIAEPVTEANIAGPGFINITLRADALARLTESLDSSAGASRLGIEPPPPPPHPDHSQTIVVDLMGVNLAKQVQVWHLRSTVIGDAIARTLERLGNRVIRQNHVGDWGLQIAMVTGRLMRLAREGTIDPDAITLDDLDLMYKAAQKECDADEAGLEMARRWHMGPKVIAELEAQVSGALEAEASAKRTLVALQSGDRETVAMWERIAKVTMDECVAICARLKANVTGVHTAGESSYRDELAGVVGDLMKRGIAVEDQGAIVVKLDDVGIGTPLIVRKSDGGFIYATTDLAAVRRRVQKLHAERVVYVVDARQASHFAPVFATAHKAGYSTISPGSGAASRTARLEHAPFGTMMGDDGRPYKTRSGESVKLADMLDEAIARADRAVAEKSPDLSPAQRRATAETIAIAAIKYADLSTERTKDYVFSYDRMMSFEGNTGPYLLYAQVRIKSIFRTAEEKLGALPAWQNAPLDLSTPEEKNLALAILRYPASVRAVADSLEPHRLCQYLYDLATTYSSFYQNCKVVGAPTRELLASRLRLCSLTARVLEDGLSLLGIPTLERM
ncbi:MAG: arginine--tRNA ligase [Phycisphaerales bacterium]